jgi:hypothetical protein
MWARQNFTGPPVCVRTCTGRHVWDNRSTACRMPKRLSNKAAASEGPKAYPLGYVEGLNDARTLLAAFFSILIVIKQRKGTRWESASKSRIKKS